MWLEMKTMDSNRSNESSDDTNPCNATKDELGPEVFYKEESATNSSFSSDFSSDDHGAEDSIANDNWPSDEELGITSDGCKDFRPLFCLVYFFCFPCLLWKILWRTLRRNSSLEHTDAPFGEFLTTRSWFRRVTRKKNTELMQAVIQGDVKKVQRLLEDRPGPKASPNAMCHTRCVSALLIAALHDNELVSILLDRGASIISANIVGRVPTHVASWSGNLRPLLALLCFPTELQKKLESGGVTPEAEDDIKKYAASANLQSKINTRCELTRCNINVPKLLRDNVHHCCEKVYLPRFTPGWTPLHAAASSARTLCCRVLLAAGADLRKQDVDGLIPVDVAGTSPHEKQPLGSTSFKSNFTEVVTILANQQNSCNLKKRPRPDHQHIQLLRRNTSLHVAVELESLEDIVLLLQCGVSPKIMNESGLTPFHLCVKKRNKQLLQVFLEYFSDKESRFLEHAPRCSDGFTVLHYAVHINWLEGVCMCLETEACTSDEPAYNGDTPLHTAAALGNLNILKQVLAFPLLDKMIDAKNENGETAIFKAIKNGHTECVKMLLQEEASIKITPSKQYNVFHVAAELGHVEVLKALLDHDKKFTRKKVDALTTDCRGVAPIHLALENDHIECVNHLLSKYTSIDLKTFSNSTLLHIAASKNNLDFAKFILKTQPSQIHEVDNSNWSPLHTASCVRARDITRLLVLHGADLSAATTGPKNHMTAIEMIMNNISKPTEFLESIFDMCIQTHRSKPAQDVYGELSFQDPDIEVIVDYNILLPKSETQNRFVKLKVINALLETGNNSGQKRLLIHPFVESFICLKWKAVVPFFYAMLFIYSLFVLTLTNFVMIGFGQKDRKSTVWNIRSWTYTLYATIVMVLIQELIFLTVNLKHYILHIETWVKLVSIILAAMLPKLMEESEPPSPDTVDWARHVATAAILLCWLYMIFLLSRFPKWGCYVLMFRKVFSNVVKILLTFACLLFGFTLSFMIQFHHQKSFGNFWTALVKTMVMMTSEFDYDDLIDDGNTPPTDDKEETPSSPMVQVLFIVFLILAAIVLMNLMVGVSVYDLNNLEVHGRIMQLEKQVEIVNSICCCLESVAFKRVFMKLLPANWLEISEKMNIKPYESNRNADGAIPAYVRDAIFKKAVAHGRDEDKQISLESVMKRLDEIRELIHSEKFKKQLNETHEKQNRFEKQKTQACDSNVARISNVDSNEISRHSHQREVVVNMATS